MSELMVRAYMCSAPDEGWSMVGESLDKSTVLSWADTFPGPFLVLHTGFFRLPAALLQDLSQLAMEGVIYCEATRAILEPELKGYPLVMPDRDALTDRIGPWHVRPTGTPIERSQIGHAHRQFLRFNRLDPESLDLPHPCEKTPFDAFMADYLILKPEHRAAMLHAGIYSHKDFEDHWALIDPDIAHSLARYAVRAARVPFEQSRRPDLAKGIEAMARAVAPWDDREMPFLSRYVQGILEANAVTTLSALKTHTAGSLRAIPRMGEQTLAAVYGYLMDYEPPEPPPPASGFSRGPDVGRPGELGDFLPLFRVIDNCLIWMGDHFADDDYKRFSAQALQMRLKGASLKQSSDLLGVPVANINGLCQHALRFIQNSLWQEGATHRPIMEIRALRDTLLEYLASPSCTQTQLDEFTDVFALDRTIGHSAFYASSLNYLFHQDQLVFAPFQLNDTAILLPVPSGQVDWPVLTSLLESLPNELLGMERSGAWDLAMERLTPAVRLPFLRSMLCNELIYGRCRLDDNGRIRSYGSNWPIQVSRRYMVGLLREAGHPLHRTRDLFHLMPADFRRSQQPGAIANILYHSQKAMQPSDPDYIFSIGRGFHTLWEHFRLSALQAGECVSFLTEYLCTHAGEKFSDIQLHALLVQNQFLDRDQFSDRMEGARAVSIMLMRAGDARITSPGRFSWAAAAFLGEQANYA